MQLRNLLCVLGKISHASGPSSINAGGRAIATTGHAAAQYGPMCAFAQGPNAGVYKDHGLGFEVALFDVGVEVGPLGLQLRPNVDTGFRIGPRTELNVLGFGVSTGHGGTKLNSPAGSLKICSIM